METLPLARNRVPQVFDFRRPLDVADQGPITTNRVDLIEGSNLNRFLGSIRKP